jgi:hypothetical protein
MAAYWYQLQKLYSLALPFACYQASTFVGDFGLVNVTERFGVQHTELTLVPLFNAVP